MSVRSANASFRPTAAGKATGIGEVHSASPTFRNTDMVTIGNGGTSDRK